MYFYLKNKHSVKLNSRRRRRWTWRALGNSPEDTEGCILAAKHLVNNGTQIQGSLKDDIIEKVSKSDHAFIEIINLNQL